MSAVARDFCRELGLKRPIVQAPMAGVQGWQMAWAVSRAGGLGSIPAALLSNEQLIAELQQFSSAFKEHGGTGLLPLNINFFCHENPAVNPAKDAEWRRILNPYYQEFGVDPSSIGAGAGRAPLSQSSLEIIEQFRPKVVSCHFGLPSNSILSALKQLGVKLWSSATTIAEGVWLQDHGIDAVIAQGLEAGGHRGMFLTQDLTTQLSTFCLLPQLISSLRVPVIAAGGIADRHSVQAVLGLGAASAQIGTSYLLCDEAMTSSIHRSALKAPQCHTALTNLFTGRAARGIMNRLMSEIGPLNSRAPEFPLAGAAIAPLKQLAEQTGRSDFSSMWSGQNPSGCLEISAYELTRQLTPNEWLE